MSIEAIGFCEGEITYIIDKKKEIFKTNLTLREVLVKLDAIESTKSPIRDGMALYKELKCPLKR